MPRSSTMIWALDDEKDQQELRPFSASMLPISPYQKDAFEKFEPKFQAANLLEGKYMKPPASISKWYKLGQITGIEHRF